VVANTSALVELDLDTKAKRLLAADPQADAADVVRQPSESTYRPSLFVYDRKRWQVLDPAIQPDLDYLRTVAGGEVEIISRTLDDRFWIVVYVVDDGPVRYYLYDRQSRGAHFLFTNRPALEGQPLVPMHSAVMKSVTASSWWRTIRSQRETTAMATVSPTTRCPWC